MIESNLLTKSRAGRGSSSWVVILTILAIAGQGLFVQPATAQVASDRAGRSARTEQVMAPLTASFTEGFESTTFPPTTSGQWYARNASAVIGSNTQCWNRFTTSPWAPHTGVGHAGANFNCTSGANTISGWLISPLITFNNGDQIRFWTRKADPDSFADRLQLRLSLDATDPVHATPFTSATDVGTFTTLLVDINPTLTTGVYPTTFTQFSATISGLGAPTTGRFAFRYFVTNGGPNGANSDIISIDDIAYVNVTQVTAGGVTVAGRVLTAPDGRGLTNAIVTITDGSGISRKALTGRNGSFSFEEVGSGQTYVVSVSSKRYTFSPRVINVSDAVSGLDFIPE